MIGLSNCSGNKSLSPATAPSNFLLRHASPRAKPFKVIRCQAASDDAQKEEAVDRRGLMLGSTAALAAVAFPQHSIAEGESKTFDGDYWMQWPQSYEP